MPEQKRVHQIRRRRTRRPTRAVTIRQCSDTSIGNQMDLLKL